MRRFRFRFRVTTMVTFIMAALLAPPLALADTPPTTDEAIAATTAHVVTPAPALFLWEADHESVIGTTASAGFIVCTTDGSKATTLIGPSPGTAMDDNAAAAPNTEEPTLSTEVANMATTDEVAGGHSTTTPTATTNPTDRARVTDGFISTTSTQPLTGSADSISQTLDDAKDEHAAAGYKIDGHRVLNDPLSDGGHFATSAAQLGELNTP